MRRLGGSRWRLRRTRGTRLAMEFEWAFFSLSVRGQALTRMLPRSRRREANTSTYAVDYLTRSVRRASGLVLADNPGVIAPGSNRNADSTNFYE